MNLNARLVAWSVGLLAVFMVAGLGVGIFAVAYMGLGAGFLAHRATGLVQR